MGIHIIKMPDIGEGIAEVELVEWHVQAGDTVVEDQVLADVMTDKATVQVPSPVHGKIVSLGGKVGQVLAVGSELIRLEVEGSGDAAAPDHPKAEPASMNAPQVSPVAKYPGPTQAPATQQNIGPPEAEIPSVAANAAGSKDKDHDRETGLPSLSSSSGKPLASPAVRQRAWDLGIELRYVAGSGPAGRITHHDLDTYLDRGKSVQTVAARSASFAARDDEEQVPVIGLRRKIAQKMQESKRRIPHFTYVEEIDVTELENLRQRLNEQWGEARGKLTILPFLVRSMVLALRDFPQINARFDDDNGVVTRYGAVHMGIAAQTPAGLMVPVLRHAEARDLWSCAAEIKRLAEAARDGQVARDELSGSTITLTSLGALGGIVSTPVVNYPEVAIVGVNRIVERPVISEGAVVARKIMNLSSSFDHRVVDGLHAAEFIQRIRRYLECPSLLFIE